MFQKIGRILTVSLERFGENNGFANAAAISYYAAFSLPSMLLISIALVGFFVEPEDVQGEIGRQVENVVGEEAADQVEQIVEAADEPKQGWFASIAGGLMLLVGATGVLVQLQLALNQVWQVKAEPTRNTWLNMVLKRVLSLGMLLVIAFLLLVTISVRAVLSELGSQLDVYLPSTLSAGMLMAVNQVVAFIILTILLAAMFRFLPDAKVPWHCVWLGGVVTAAMFSIGKQLMGVYLNVSNPGAVYGAAGSLAIILIWVYYASAIVIFGAQLTQVWSSRHGDRLQPEGHAVKQV